jgi:hypothetical protein
MEPRTINNQNHLRKCGRLFTHYSLSQLSLLLVALVPTRLRCFIPKTIAPAYREVRAGMNALVKSCIATINRRVVCGLLIMLVGTPLAYCIYGFFERGGSRVPDWYHVNFWHFFFFLRFQISQVVFLTGLYIYMMESQKIKVLAIYHGFMLMALFQNVVAESNEDIWRGINWYLFGAFAVLCLTFYFMLDWLAKRKFHGEDRYIAREQGLLQVAFAMPAEQFRDNMVKNLNEKYEFQKQ